MRFHFATNSSVFKSSAGQRIDQTELGLLIQNIARSLTDGRRGEIEIAERDDQAVIEVLADDHFLPGAQTLYLFTIDETRWPPVAVRELTPAGTPKRDVTFGNLRLVTATVGTTFWWWIAVADAAREAETKAHEEVGLGLVGPHDAAQTDLASLKISQGEDDVGALDARELAEDGSWRVAEAGSLLPLFEGLPEYEGQKSEGGAPCRTQSVHESGSDVHRRELRGPTRSSLRPLVGCATAIRSLALATSPIGPPPRDSTRDATAVDRPSVRE